jgi:hypothetical protein
MSKKKGKRKRARRRAQHRSAKAKARARRRLQGGPLADSQIIATPRRQIKMSVVLEDFVEPYLDLAEESLEVQRKLFTIAIVAWNTALVPEELREEILEGSLRSAMRGASAEDKQGLRAIVNGMVERKLALFDQYKRFIVDFELVEDKDAFHLSVMSTEGPG